MSDITVETKKNNITLQLRSQNITIEVNRIGGSGVRTVTGITITANQETVINTGQSSVRPRFIQLYNSAGKRIDKNMPEPTVTLSTNYIVTYAKQLIPYSDITMYYI